MRRIPWFAVAILASLLVAALPLASAEPLPASTYLQLVPIVGQQPPSPQHLVLRDADLPAERRGYTVDREGAVTNEAAAAAYVDPAAALAQFAAQGRLESYELVGTKNAFPGTYITTVTRYATTGGAAAGLDMVIDAPARVGTDCEPWKPYTAVELYGGEQARAKELVCFVGRIQLTYEFVAVRHGTYVVTMQLQTQDPEIMKAFVTPAVAKLP
jgi:hypothetical protein